MDISMTFNRRQRRYHFSNFLIALGCALLCLLLNLLFLRIESALAEWIVSEGSGSVENGDIAEAKETALHDAERNAIERAIGAMVESESLVENYVLIKDRIFTRVEGYVKKLQIIEEKCDKTQCKVKIKAEVGSRDLADDVAALVRVLPKMNYPTVAIAVRLNGLNQELRPVEADLSRIAEDTLIGLFKAKGFIVVEQESIQRERERQARLFKAAEDRFKEAIEEVSDNAQLFISGEAAVQDAGPSPFNDRIHAYSAVISARAMDTATGAVLSSYSAEASVPSHSFVSGARKALLKAADKLGEKIAHDIVKVWLDACYNAHNVKLIVEDIPFSSLARIRHAIEEKISGVSSVSQRSYMRKRAVLVVRWRNCNIQRLAEKLSEIMIADFGHLEVLEADGNRLRVRLSGH